MAPVAFGIPGKAATPRETPTKKTPWKSEQMLPRRALRQTPPQATRQEATNRLAQQRPRG